MKKSDSIKNLAAALSKAQSEIKVAEMDGFNPHYKSKFATLKSVVAATRPALTKHGLSVIHLPSTDSQGKPTLETVMTHESGEWMSEVTPLILSKQDMQGFVASVTYAKRMALSAVTGAVADEDDDGNASVGKGAESKGKATKEKVNAPNPFLGEDVDLSQFKVTFGKHVGNTLGDIPFEELKDYVDYINKEALKKKKPIQGKVLEFVEAARAFLGGLETRQDFEREMAQ